MKRVPIILAAVVMMVTPSAAAPRDFPPEVAEHMKHMADICEEAGGKPLADKFVVHDRLNGVEVWAINEGAFNCDGAASMFSGSGGSQVVVFMRSPDGNAKKVFEHGAYGMEMQRSGPVVTLWIGVGGPLCGQPGSPSHTDSLSCDRSLVWDNAARRLDFTPLSEARIPGRLHN